MGTRTARDRAAARRQLGERAEALVASYLTRNGFVLVEQNARAGGGELDLIARKGGLLVFCEVRARRRAGWVSPVHTLDRAKRTRVRRAAAAWLAARAVPWAREIRLDFAAVTFDTAEGNLEYFEGAFE